MCKFDRSANRIENDSLCFDFHFDSVCESQEAVWARPASNQRGSTVQLQGGHLRKVYSTRALLLFVVLEFRKDDARPQTRHTYG